jgi:hypothetical protein
MKAKGKYKTECCYASCKTPYPETVIWYCRESESYCCTSCAIMVNNGTVKKYVRLGEGGVQKLEEKIKELRDEVHRTLNQKISDETLRAMNDLMFTYIERIMPSIQLDAMREIASEDLDLFNKIKKDNPDISKELDNDIIAEEMLDWWIENNNR